MTNLRRATARALGALDICVEDYRAIERIVGTEPGRSSVIGKIRDELAAALAAREDDDDED